MVHPKHPRPLPLLAAIATLAGASVAHETDPAPAIVPAFGQDADEVPEAPAEAAPEAPAVSTGSWSDLVSGSLRVRYRGRMNDDDEDHDLSTSLSLDFGDAERDPFSGHLAATGFADLDGNDEGGGFSFFNINDTWSSSVTGRLYEAWLDVNEIDGLDLLRVGRQQSLDTPVYAWFDGLRFETEGHGEGDLRFGAYGGVPVHLFESSASGDSLYGAFGEARPWRGGRVRADWMHFEDESLLGTADNDLLNLGFWQSATGMGVVDGAFSMLDGNERDWKLGVTALFDRTTVRLGYYELLRTQGQLATEIDPYYGLAFDLFPYQQAQVSISHLLTDDVSIDLGSTLRTVDDAADEGEFNRDYDRHYLAAGLADLADTGVDLTLTGELWDADGNEVESWGLDLAKELNDDSEASIGTYYSLYKWDFFFDSEREDVRTWYLRLRHQWSERVRLDFDYEFEQGDDDDFQTVKLGLRWTI